jgi:hypothetical protein
MLSYHSTGRCCCPAAALSNFVSFETLCRGTACISKRFVVVCSAFQSTQISLPENRELAVLRQAGVAPRMEWLIKPFMHLEKLLRHLGEAGVLHDILHCSGGSSQQTSTPSRLSELFAQSSMSSKTHSSRVQIILITCIVCLHLVSATIAPRPGSSWSGGSSSSKGRKSYYAGPRPGFTGGQALNNNRPRWCTSPELPGCQACYDGRCTACWGQYPNTTGTSYGLGPPGGSRFVLNLATGQCGKYSCTVTNVKCTEQPLIWC